MLGNEQLLNILYYFLIFIIFRTIIKENNIQLTKEQIKKINAYNTWNILADEHRDEMWLDDYPNGNFFDSIMDCAEDDALIY